MKRLSVALLAVVLFGLLLSGCGGKALPNGMDEDTLLTAGRTIVLDVVAGEYEAVYQAFREDVRSSTSVEALRALAVSGMDGAGVYKEIDGSMTTGQTVQGTPIGVAVFSCRFSDDSVLFRVSFDEQMTLVGLSIQKQ